MSAAVIFSKIAGQIKPWVNGLGYGKGAGVWKGCTGVAYVGTR
jgi:hypothetical protein